MFQDFWVHRALSHWPILFFILQKKCWASLWLNPIAKEMLSTKKAIGLSVWLALKHFFKNQYLHLICFCLISDKPICLLWCLSHLTKGIAILQSVNNIMWFSTTFPKPPLCNSATVHARNLHILAEPTLCFRNNKKNHSTCS